MMGSVEYWNRNARWYKLWIDHNNYHESIVEVLRCITKPGWKVLDIGGGGGVLALPLVMNQCDVVVVEPSWAMRVILDEEIRKQGRPSGIKVDARRWEEIDNTEFCDYDLILACNSLHLVRLGFEGAFKKIFTARAPHIFIVTEQPLNGLGHYAEANNYQLIGAEAKEQESSFVYHSRGEAIEHWLFRYGTDPNDMERQDLLSKLIEEEGHFRLKGETTVYSYHWRRTETDTQ